VFVYTDYFTTKNTKDTKSILVFFLRALRELRGCIQLRMAIGHGPPEGRALGPLWLKNFLIGGESMRMKLKIAAFAGIFYLVSALPELASEALYEFSENTSELSTFLAFTYIISIISTIVFFYGFIQLGIEHHNNILVFSSVIIIVITFFYYLYSWYTRDLPEMEPDVFGGTVLFLFGFAGLFFGYGLYSLREEFGKYAKIAGVLEIIVGVCFITIILFLLGLIIGIPAIIFEILLLFNLSESPEYKKDPAVSAKSQE